MPGLGPRELGPSMVGSGPRVWGLRPHTPEPVLRVAHSASRRPRSLHPQASQSPRMTLFSCPGASCRLLLPTPACADPQLCAACLPWEAASQVSLPRLGPRWHPWHHPTSPAPFSRSALPHSPTQTACPPALGLLASREPETPCGSTQSPALHTSPIPPGPAPGPPSAARPGWPEKAQSDGVTSFLRPHQGHDPVTLAAASPETPLPAAWMACFPRDPA